MAEGSVWGRAVTESLISGINPTKGSGELGFAATFWASASPGLFPSEDECW